MANLAKAETVLTINQAHGRLGHMHEDRTRLTAKALGWTIKPGCFEVCKACAEGKAKQKNVPKISEHIKATKEAPRIFLDLATVKDRLGKTELSKPNWRIMVDERTGMKFCDFFARKSDMIEPTCQQLHKWKQAGLSVKYIRLDNAGENKKLEERCSSADWKLDIVFEYTARDTPQQNSLAELGLTVLSALGRSIMAAANVPEEIRNKGVWREAIKTATDLDALAAIELDGVLQPRVKHWSGKMPAYANHLKTWGEAGTVKTKNKMTTKIEDRGITCMFVGYAKQHSGDCYRMLNLNTMGIHETRDIIWLHRMFFPPKLPSLEHSIVPAVDFPVQQAGERGANSHVEQENQNNGENNNNADVDQIFEIDDSSEDGSSKNDNDKSNRTTTRSGRTIKPVNRLEINPKKKTYNSNKSENKTKDGDEVRDLTNAEVAFYAAIGAFETKNNDKEFACVGLGAGDGFLDTSELHVMKYKEAMETPEANEWEKAVDEEHKRMVKNKVFKAVPVQEVPEGSKILTSTWSMKKKPNGTKRARIVARGFEQIDGEHYKSDETAAPVVNDMTIRIVLILMIMARFCGELVDVQGAFLLGEFGTEEKLYMEVPEGFKKFYPAYVVLLLLKTIYGLKQAAYAFWRKLIEAFWAMGYERCKGDPCLYFKWTNELITLWMSWVDDCFVCG